MSRLGAALLLVFTVALITRGHHEPPAPAPTAPAGVAPALTVPAPAAPVGVVEQRDPNAGPPGSVG